MNYEAKDILVVEQEIAKKVLEEKSVPAGYIPVKLSSQGRLGFPEIVHVRDYTYEEALMIAELTDDTLTEGLLDILNNMILEDVKAEDAHTEDLTEILLSVYGTWYSQTLETFYYTVDESLTGDEARSPENRSVATIPINSIRTKPLSDKVGQYITIKRDERTVKFTTSKAGNEVTAWKYAVRKNLANETQIEDAIKAIKLGVANPTQTKAYADFTKKRTQDFLKALQAMLVVEVDGKSYTGLDQQLEAINLVPLSFWSDYHNTIKEHYDFGVQSEVEFLCSIKHEPITRRFRFRPFHFLPILAEGDSAGSTISFS